MRFNTCLMMALILGIGGCASTPDKLQGRVFDEKTKVPVKDVVITAAWERTTGPHNSFIGMAWVAETLTDGQGSFSLPAWRAGWPSDVDANSPTLMVIKDGYQPTVLRGADRRDLARLEMVRKDTANPLYDGAIWQLRDRLLPILTYKNPECWWKKIPRTIIEIEKINDSYKDGQEIYGIDDIPTTPLCGNAQSFFQSFHE